MEHRPVLLQEVLGFLRPERGGVYVDCTIGEGGHSAAILEAGSEDTIIVGIDRDEEILRVAEKRLEAFKGRFHLVHGNFASLKEVLSSLNIKRVAGVLFDFGISSYHLNRPERGFSFMHDGPLDMRMDRSQATTAADLVNRLKESELRDIFREYGEERWATRIARRIVWARANGPLETTAQLATTIRGAIPPPQRRRRINPATRSFQALRIKVNNELEPLPGAVMEAMDILQPGGRGCFISYHSLEDRQVKRVLRALERGCDRSLEPTASTRGRGVEIKNLTPKPITPTAAERAASPRSRSAKLRAAEKV